MLSHMPCEAISDKTDLLLSKSGRVVKLDFGPIVGRGSSLDSHAITYAAHPARATTIINRSSCFILTIGSSLRGGLCLRNESKPSRQRCSEHSPTALPVFEHGFAFTPRNKAGRGNTRRGGGSTAAAGSMDDSMGRLPPRLPLRWPRHTRPREPRYGARRRQTTVASRACR